MRLSLAGCQKADGTTAEGEGEGQKNAPQIKSAERFSALEHFSEVRKGTAGSPG